MNQRLQLEMPLEPKVVPCRGRTTGRRLTRARWWFSQMRLAVEQASDWEPVERPSGLEGNGSSNEVSRSG